MRPSSWTMVLAVVVVLLVGRIGYQHLASAAQPCDCHCESAQALVAARDVAPHEQLLQQQQYTQLLTQQLQQQKTLLEQLQLQLAKQQQNSNNNNNIVAAAPAAVAPAAAAPAAALPRCGTGKAERRILNSLKRTNHRFGMAGAPPEVLVFDPETLVYAPGKRLHPDYHVVIDVGAYDGSDWAFVPHGLGYSVVSFELSPENWGKWTQKAASQGLSEGNQYTTVTFASADAVGKPTPQSSHLQIPTKDATPHVFFVKAGASDKNIGVSVNSGDVMAQVHAAGGGGASNTMVVRIDDLVPPSTRVFAMKIDTQGHECHVIKGAEKLLASGNVYTLVFEFAPTLMREQGCDPLETLHQIYDLGYICFDLHTHPRYVPLNRPSDLAGFVAYLESVPKVPNTPFGDPLGGWEDIMCQLNLP